MKARAAAPGWSEIDLSELKQGFRENLSVTDIAGYLLRTEEDVLRKAHELGMKLAAR
jgi:hypothetical protein